MATAGVGMTSPKTLTGMTVNTGLLQKKWLDNMIYMESVQGDAILGNGDLIKPIEVEGSKAKVPMLDSMMIDVTPKDKKGKSARSVEVVFLKSLDMAPREGNAEGLLGYEDEAALKYTTLYANDWAGGLTEQMFGIDYRELAPYGIDEKTRALLSQWLSEVRGLYVRQAFMTGISQNLAKAPVSLTAGLTANWYLPGLTFANQPSYDSTLADLENNIGAKCTSAYGSSNHFNVPECLKLIDYARDEKYIEGVTVNGKQMYVLYLCTDEMRNMLDPSVSNSWGAYYQNTAAIQDVQKVVPAAQVVIGDELILARDPRYVTMALTGNASDYTMTFGYLKAGRVSTRHSTRSSGYFNVNILAGRGSLGIYEPEAPHFEEQKDEHGKFVSTGLFGGVGYKAIKWDLDSASQTDNTAQQEGFINVITSRS